jgi:hypothetical protein
MFSNREHGVFCAMMRCMKIDVLMAELDRLILAHQLRHGHKPRYMYVGHNYYLELMRALYPNQAINRRKAIYQGIEIIAVLKADHVAVGP